MTNEPMALQSGSSQGIADEGSQTAPAGRSQMFEAVMLALLSVAVEAETRQRL